MSTTHTDLRQREQLHWLRQRPGSHHGHCACSRRCPGPKPITATVGAILALLAGLLALATPATAATPADPPRGPVTPAATTVTVDPQWRPADGLRGQTNTTLTQSDGKVIIGGPFQSVGGVRRAALARLNADGTHDPSFNNGVGLVNDDDAGILRGRADVWRLAAAPDGDIVVVGSFTSYNGVPRPGVMRLNSDGSLDAGFVPSGFANVSEYLYYGGTVLVQPDGKVIIALAEPITEPILRLNANGTRDATFTPPAGFSGGAAVLQPDGKILIGGSSLLRLEPNGARDLGFEVKLPMGDSMYPTGQVLSLALQPDGKIVMGGAFTKLNMVPAPNIARLNPDGTRDATFNPGKGPDNMAPHAEAPAASTSPSPTPTWQSDPPLISIVRVDSEGRIVVAGVFTSFAGTAQDHLARLLPSGALDAGFHYAPPSGPDAPLGVRQDDYLPDSGGWLDVRPDRTLLLASNPLTRVAVDGTVGPWRGAAATNGNGASGSVSAVAVDSAGRVLVGGRFSEISGRPANGIARLNPDGTFDETFDVGSGIDDDAPSDPFGNAWSEVRVVTELPDGRVMVAGTFHRIDGTPRAGLARLTSTGAVDPTFNPPAGFTSHVFDVEVLPDGRIVVAGAIRLAPNGPWYAAVRVNSDGSRDESFTPLTIEPQTNWLESTSIVRQRDGSLVVAGNFTKANGQTANNIVRLLPNGAIDPAFATGAGFDGPVAAMGLMPDGRIVVGGSFDSYRSTPAHGMVRLLPGDELDPTFSVGLGFNDGYAFMGGPTALAVAGDGSVVAGGMFERVQGHTRNGLARLTSSGALDLGFDDGMTKPDWRDYSAIAVQNDGRIIVGGFFDGFGGAFPEPHGITRLVVPMTPASAPRDVAVTNGDGQVAVWFVPPVSFGGAPVTNYEYSVDGGGWQAVAPASTVSPVVIGGLTNGVSYRLRLRARTAAGGGVSSAEVTARPVAARASSFVPIEPARVVDTRPEAGGGGPIPGGTTRRFSVASRVGGGQVVPAGALAVAYNVTVPSPAGAGHVRVMPGDAVGLTSTSAINFRASETIANAASVNIDANREVLVYAGATANVVLDVVGYYMPLAAVPASVAGPASVVAPASVAAPASAGQVAPATVGGRFTAVTPVRVYDSSLAAAGNLAAGATRTVGTGTTQDGVTAVVPAGASAVAYNVTVVNTAGGGHLRVMPGNVAASATSAINWTRAGEVIANASVVGIDKAQQIRVFNGSGAPVRFLVDVVGYYSAVGQAFYPIDPVRTTETRWLQGGAGPVAPGPLGVRTASTATIPGTSFTVVPAGGTAAGYNLTAVNTGGVGHARVYPTGAPLVTASALNWPGAGYTRANASVVAVSAGREVTIYNGSGAPTDALIDINGYYK